MMDQPGRYWIGLLLMAAVLTACATPAVIAASGETSAGEPAASPSTTDLPNRAEIGSDEKPDPDQDDARDEPETAEHKRPLTEEELLIREAKQLLDELHRLRQELADARLAKAEMQRELEEMRQFIEDHHEYGQDFEEYQRIRAIKRREQQERERREARDRYERERQQRMQRQEAVREARLERRAADRRDREFRRHGFEPIGMDVYVGRMAYQYRIRDTLRTRITYDPFFGFFTQRDYRDRIDFTEMILSGAILHVSDEVLNIGVAITFFDGSGNQVGHEIVQINNARPEVPYPFTSTVSMALNRPFTTSSSYVLFADPVDVN